MEEKLTGGLVTRGIVRIGNTVRRPKPSNLALQAALLKHLEEKGISAAPRVLGIDEKGRFTLEYLEGDSPDDLGHFTDEACTAAARIIRILHDALWDLPGIPKGSTVCHGDLSPCNFIFRDGSPYAVIDWDAAHAGDPLTDLAYAIWLWLDAGNPEVSPPDFRRREIAMLDAYGFDASACPLIKEKMIAEALRVSKSIFPSPEQTRATGKWARSCADWIRKNAY